MSHLKYSCYEGWGPFARDNLHYSQAVRIGDIIECSGQGGWDSDNNVDADDIRGQYERAFENVEKCLKDAGGKGWSEVFSIRTYHVDWKDEQIDMMVELMRKYMPNHQPIWTLVPVPALGLKTMKVEIEVRAHVAFVEA